MLVEVLLDDTKLECRSQCMKHFPFLLLVGNTTSVWLLELSGDFVSSWLLS